MGDFWIMGDLWIMGDFWIMDEGGTNTHIDTHINTMTRPGLGAWSSENIITIIIVIIIIIIVVIIVVIIINFIIIIIAYRPPLVPTLLEVLWDEKNTLLNLEQNKVNDQQKPILTKKNMKGTSRR